MYRWDYRDIVAGLAISCFGLAISWYAFKHYNIGTLAVMGAGMFPAVLGVILVLFGIIVAVSGLLKRGEALEFELRPSAVSLLSLALFALMVKPFGMIPAVMTLSLTASAARERPTLRSLLLAIILSAMAVVIFIFGLGLPIDIARWP